jgi:hypothetical protein
MKKLHKAVVHIALVAPLFAAWLAFTQTPVIESSSDTKAAAPAAYVYVQTHQGVDVYDAASNGKLTLVKGSPFATSGQLGGINGSYLLSVGTADVHTYPIGTNGAVGKQASEVNTQDYSGAQCGNTTGLPTFLDHTGKNFYLQLSGVFNGGSVACVAWQSYKINSNGSFDFLGSMEYAGYQGHDAGGSTLPTVNSSDKFAYGIFSEFAGYSDTAFATLTRASNGDLGVIGNFKETDPKTNPALADGPWGYYPFDVQADPSEHLAVALVPINFPLEGQQQYGPPQLASYTINSAGSITSTNTWENMPTPAVTSIGAMSMSTSGKLLAVGGAQGLQLFHFNGASPLTTFSKLLLPGTEIDQLAWDNNNHLYALSYKSGELYVYTVTPTSYSEVSGSPYKVANTYGLSGLIVVPKS